MRLFFLRRLHGLSLITQGLLYFIGINLPLGILTAKMIAKERHKNNVFSHNPFGDY